jgi:hypothetical protein
METMRLRLSSVRRLLEVVQDVDAARWPVEEARVERLVSAARKALDVLDIRVEVLRGLG